MLSSRLALLLFVSLPCFGAQSAADFSAAHFGEKLPEFVENLRFPNHSAGSAILIKCGAMVHLSGEMEGTICFSNDDYVIENRIRKVIVRSTRKFRITPATIDGERESVWFNFSVIYEQKGEIKTIEVLENHLYDIESLGPHYTAAQRSLSKFDLKCFDPKELPISVLANVSAEGQVAQLQFSKDPQENQCASEIEKIIRNSLYIPATVEGKPAASTYNEVFHHYQYDPGN